MESPLWTEAHRPDLAELPQDDVREYLERAVEEPINLILQGPPGSGKTAAARALAGAAHRDPDNDLIVLNIADFFDRTKKEIRDDSRFSRFLQGEISWVKQKGSSEKEQISKRYKSDWSKAEMVSHVLDEYAGMSPSSGDYKTLVLDNAEAAREDFQHALRRTMERHHRNTQFVLTTRQPSKLIPPIRSRCFPVPVRAPTVDESVAVLEGIVEAEDAQYDRDGLEFVAGASNGDLRNAILSAQTIHEETGEITMQTAYETLGEIGFDEEIESMFAAAEAGEFTDARSTLNDLLIDEGLTGDEVLDSVLQVGRSRYDGEHLAELHRLAGEIDLDMVEGADDRIHLSHLLAELGREA